MNILQHVFKQVIGRYSFSSLISSILGNNTVLPCVIHSGIRSGRSIHSLKLLTSAFQVPLSFFHQKFCIPSIPGADQFFLFVIVNSSILVTFALFFSATVLIYRLCEVLVSSSQMPPTNSTNFSIPGTSPLLSLVLLSFCKTSLRSL